MSSYLGDKMKLEVKFILAGIILLSLSGINIYAEEMNETDIDLTEQRFFETVGKSLNGKSKENKNEVGIKAIQISETPNGANNKDLPAECDPNRIDDQVINQNLTNSTYVDYLKKYFNKCSRHLIENSETGYWGLFKFSQNNYQFFNHPKIKQINFKLNDGTTLPAILAMKDEKTKRPFVVVKCGVFCSANQGPSNKNYLMSFFDQSPFNVLIISNKTGMDYIANNHLLNLGGWTEGLEAVEIGKWVKFESPFRHLISSLHFAGISLGGNAAVFSTYYNDLEYELNGQKIFNSSMAICPVISLRDSLDKLYSHEIVGKLFYKETRDQLLNGKKYLFDVSDLINEKSIPGRENMRSFLGKLATTSLQRRGAELSEDDFYRKNNFFNIKKSISTPLLVWASKDDMIVDYTMNAGSLLGSQVFTNAKNMHLLSLNYGTHCAFSNAYGLKAASSVIRNYILINSPEIKNQYEYKTLEWQNPLPILNNSEIHTSQVWKFFKDSKDVQINFRSYNFHRSEKCEEQGPWGTENICNENNERWIPISSLENIGARVPKTQAEADSMSREFNAKIEFVNNKGKSIVGTNARKVFIKIKSIH